MPSTHVLLLAAEHLMVTASDYEDPADFDAALDAWAEQTGDKLAAYAAVHACAKGAIARDTEQRNAWDAAIKRSERTVERVKEGAAALLAKLEETGKPAKVPGVARLQTNGGRVPLLGLDTLDAATLPDALVIVSRVPDTAAIRARVEAGETVPGVSLGAPGRHVRFE